MVEQHILELQDLPLQLASLIDEGTASLTQARLAVPSTPRCRCAYHWYGRGTFSRLPDYVSEGSPSRRRASLSCGLWRRCPSFGRQGYMCGVWVTGPDAGWFAFVASAFHGVLFSAERLRLASGPYL